METSSIQVDPWAAGASQLREQLLEHQLLGEIVRLLALQGRRCEVLRTELDGSGHDVVLEEGRVLRHVQLKAMRADGKRANVNIHTALATKTSGCVIWMLVNPATLKAERYLWLGGPPGEPLPSLGDRVVRHTKGDARGLKGLRTDLREMRRSRFTPVDGVDELITLLFGTAKERDILSLKLYLRAGELVGPLTPAWLAHVQAGRFDAMPAALDEEELVQLSHLVDGYELAGIPGPEAAGPFVERIMRAAHAGQSVLPSNLWATMFLEHRRLRFEGREPTVDEAMAIRSLYEVLREDLQT